MFSQAIIDTQSWDKLGSGLTKIRGHERFASVDNNEIPKEITRVCFFFPEAFALIRVYWYAITSICGVTPYDI